MRRRATTPSQLRATLWTSMTASIAPLWTVWSTRSAVAPACSRSVGYPGHHRRCWPCARPVGVTSGPAVRRHRAELAAVHLLSRCYRRFSAIPQRFVDRLGVAGIHRTSGLPWGTEAQTIKDGALGGTSSRVTLLNRARSRPARDRSHAARLRKVPPRLSLLFKEKRDEYLSQRITQ